MQGSTPRQELASMSSEKYFVDTWVNEQIYMYYALKSIFEVNVYNKQWNNKETCPCLDNTAVIAITGWIIPT